MDNPNNLFETKWAYGVTVVPERRDNVFLRTMGSLRSAGFDRPWLFVDGDSDSESWQREFECSVSIRYPRIRAYGNWILGLYELYIRNPNADRYAIFQDDIVCSANLRKYLDASTKLNGERLAYRAAHPKTARPDKVYWNLFTFQSNQDLAKGHTGWYESNQNGRGAAGLVFTLEGVVTLLNHQHMIDRVQDEKRGHKSIDGGIIQTMKKAGFRELVHNPSLIQHIGSESAIGNLPHQPAKSFQGESFDLMELTNGKKEAAGAG